MTAPRTACIVVVVVMFAVVTSTLWPLLTYSASLACFGLLHVVVELRYVRSRFGDHLPMPLWWSCGALLAAIVGVRALRLAGVAGELAGPLELVLVAAMLVVGAVLAARWSRVGGAFGVVAAAVVVAGAVAAPIETVLALAILHNLTPLGFVVERAAPAERTRTAVIAGLVFIGAPLLVASGLPLRTAPQLVDLTTSFPSTPPLFESYRMYLWPALVEHERALSLFSAAVCAQVLHYAAVIAWLPRGASSSSSSSSSVLAAFAVVVVGLAAHFAVDFVGARGVYGLVAAVHAWIELPVLLVALSMITRRA